MSLDPRAGAPIDAGVGDVKQRWAVEKAPTEFYKDEQGNIVPLAVGNSGRAASMFSAKNKVVEVPDFGGYDLARSHKKPKKELTLRESVLVHANTMPDRTAVRTALAVDHAPRNLHAKELTGMNSFLHDDLFFVIPEVYGSSLLQASDCNMLKSVVNTFAYS